MLLKAMTNSRNTIQRQLVLSAVRQLQNHPTADEVYLEVQKNCPTISRATVYRNLKLLAEEGEIRLVSVELSEDNHRQFFIPQGFAHGFLTLTPDVEFRYKVDNVYNKESEGGMRYDDPTVNVDWGSLLQGIEPVLSEKDQIGPTLEESDNQFVYGENC